MPDAPYHAMESGSFKKRNGGTPPSAATIAALAAIAFISGSANGYNGFLLEGCIPRMFAAGVITTVEQAGLLGGALSFGGLVGSFACAELTYRLSRRHVVVLGEVVILLGALTFAGANSFPLVLLGRVLTGSGVGICGLAKPLIVSELAPPHMRGTLVSLVAVGQSIGLNLLYVADFALPPASSTWAWRALVLFGATPAAAVVVLALATSRSDYWDVAPCSIAPAAGAEEALVSDTPLEQIRQLCSAGTAWQTRRNFGLILAMMVGYNLSGTLVIANYAGDILASAGAYDRSLPIIIGLVQFLGLLSATLFVDRVGRRLLLLGSCVLTAASLFAMAALLGWMEGTEGGGAASSSSWSAPSLLALMVAVEYAVGAGLNPIRIILSAELMPSRFRPLGMSLGNTFGWTMALLSLYLYPVLAAHASGPAPQFAFFGSVVTALTVLLVWQLPETNGIDFD